MMAVRTMVPGMGMAVVMSAIAVMAMGVVRSHDTSAQQRQDGGGGREFQHRHVSLLELEVGPV